MISLRIVGLYKGTVDLPATASVMELKEVVAAASGLSIGNIKLLAGGKHLNEDGRTLQGYGVSSPKTIMVLRQEAAPEARAEDEAMRRVAAAVAATASGAAAAVAHAADYGSDDDDTGSRGSSSDRNGSGSYGSHGDNVTHSNIHVSAGARSGSGGGLDGRRGRGLGSRRSGAKSRRPRLELTNQDGELMDIAEGESALLMQGMLLHDKGKACMRQAALAVTRAKAARRAAAAAEATAATAAAAVATMATPATAASASERSGVEEAKESMLLAHVNAAAAAAAATVADDVKLPVPVGAEPSIEAPASSAATAAAAATAVAADAAASGASAPATAATAVAAPKLPAASAYSASTPGGSTALEDAVRLAHAEALGYFLAAQEVYGRVNAKYLDAIDNYAYLCLDTAWLLFLTRDMKRLSLAARLLKEAEEGFRRSHGAGLERLTALKGEHCAERALYVRLHLLQGVVLFLEGRSGEASALLIRAATECRALSVAPQMVRRLRRESATVWGMPIDAKLATRAVRAGRGTLDGARQFLEAWRQRQQRIGSEEERRRQQRRQRRWGKTADGRSFVDDVLVSALVDAGHSHAASVAAARQANNDAAAAMVALTAPAADRAAAANAEAMARLLSLGVPEDAAGQALALAGSLAAALAQLGLDSSEGSGGSGSSGSSGSRSGIGTGTSSWDGSGFTSTGSSGGRAAAAATPEERQRRHEEEKLFRELALEVSQDDEAHLDASLADEAAAIEMYMRLCEGKIPARFDLAKIATAATRGSTGSSHGDSGGGSGSGGSGGGKGMDT